MIQPLAVLLALAWGEPFRDVPFDQALAEAARTDRMVFVDFFTTWCAPCKKLDAVTWANADVKVWLAEATVPLKLDAEQERELATRYGVRAFPTLLFLKPDGTELDRLVGFREPAAFLEEARAIVRGETVLDGLRAKLVGHETDVGLRMDLGRELARRGKHAEALAHFLWIYDEGLEHEPSYAGVRNSFLLGDISRLGREHPPALEALRRRRDACVAAFEAGTAGAQEAVDVASLNRELGENEATLRLYDRLAASERLEDQQVDRMRDELFRWVTDGLVEARRYADLLAGEDDPVGALERRIELAREMTSGSRFDEEARERLLSAARSQRTSTFGKVYEALLGTQRDEEARAVRGRLIEADASYATFNALVGHAARAEAPEEVEALLARAAETLPEKERKRLERAAKRAPR